MRGSWVDCIHRSSAFVRRPLAQALDDSTITYVLAAGTALNGVGKFAGGVLIDRYGARCSAAYIYRRSADEA